MDAELQQFYFYLVQEGLRQNSIKVYLYGLQRIYKEIKTFDEDAVIRWLIEQKINGANAVYLNHYCNAVRSYGRFRNLEKLKIFRDFKEEKTIRSTLSDAEIKAFLTLPPVNKGKKMKEDYDRWTLFFSILAYTGMRPGEVAHLTIDRVDFGRGVFVLEITKTTPRVVPIPPHLIPRIKKYINLLSTAYLFPSRKGGTYRQGGVVNDVDWGYNFHTRCRLGCWLRCWFRLNNCWF